jgi:hypothetical protein
MTETTINREPQERMCKKVIVVCPTSLIGNWDNEINKWLAGKIRTCPLESGPHVDKNIRGFLGHYAMSPEVLIMSYETFLRCERSRIVLHLAFHTSALTSHGLPDTPRNSTSQGAGPSQTLYSSVNLRYQC